LPIARFHDTFGTPEEIMMSLRRFASILAFALALGTPSAALAQYAFTTTTVDMRAGPDGSYPLVLRVYPNTQVLIHGCISNWSWCDVTVGYERGWIYAPNLWYPYQGSNVVIYGNGPILGLPIVTFSIAPYWDHWYRNRPWWYQRNDWYYRAPPPPRPPPPGWRPPRPPPPGWRPPPGPRPPGIYPPPDRPPPGTGRPPPPPNGGRPPPQPPPGGGRPPPARPMPTPKPAPPTSAPPGPAPTPR
jgi:uncharacterized protein YraI